MTKKKMFLATFTVFKTDILKTERVYELCKYFIIVQKLDNVHWTETLFIGVFMCARRLFGL